MIELANLLEQLEAEGLEPHVIPADRWIRFAVKAACKEADPMLAFIVPAHTDARWWRRYAVQGEIRLLGEPIGVEGRPYAVIGGKPPDTLAVLIFGRSAATRPHGSDGGAA